MPSTRIMISHHLAEKSEPRAVGRESLTGLS